MLYIAFLVILVLVVKADDRYERLSWKDGVYIEHKGKVYISGDSAPNDLISILVSIPDVFENISQLVGNTNQDCATAHREGLKSFNAAIYNLWESNNKYADSRRDILAEYIANKKDKRQIAAVLGIGGILLGGGLSLGLNKMQLDKVRRHVRDNQAEIESIKDHINDFSRQLAETGKLTISLIKDARKDFDEALHTLHCDLFWSEAIARVKSSMDKYQATFDQIMATSISGKNSELLTPFILDANAVNHVTNKMGIFRNTIFHADPYLLYGTSKISLIDISKDLKIAHFVLTFPHVPADTTPLELYEINQVGIYYKSDTCAFREMPDHVIMKYEGYTGIKLDSCYNHNNIWFCQPDALETDISCVQPDNNNCHFHEKECTADQNSFEYISSLSGLLLRNNQNTNTFINFLNGSIGPVALTEYQTGFVNWTNVSEVQIGNTKVSSPVPRGKPITLVNYMDNYTLTINNFSHLAITESLRLLTEKYNKSLNDLLYPVLERGHSQGHMGLFNIFTLIWGTLLSLWVVGLSLCTFVIVHKLSTKRSGNILEIRQKPANYLELSQEPSRLIELVDLKSKTRRGSIITM